MNAQQLKNSILQEAIEGCLVPQDPNDEPASVLLDRIRKEKARLVKEGKLKKKDLEEKPIGEDEKPFEIPENWEWVRIKTILSLQAGKNVTAANISSEQNSVFKYPCFGGNGLRGYVKEYNTDGNFPLIGRQGALCGNVNMADGKFWATEHAVVTDGFNMTNVKWQYYFLIALNLNKYATATAQPGLAVSNIIEVPIPLPPLAEQQRIVAKIEELLPNVEEYGKAQEALDKLNAELPERLKKSILQEAIEGRLVPQDPNDEPASVLLDRIRKEKAKLVKEGKLKKSALKEESISDEEKPFEIPNTWEWCKLGWIGDWGAGATPAKGNPEFYNNGTIPWLRTGELNNGYVYDSEIKVTEKALEKCSLRMCQKGDVLIAMYGATIGKVAIVGIELTTNQACCACTPYLIYNKYLLYYLLASKKAFIELGEGGAQPNISREKIVAFPFPLPPLAEQRRIVAKIEELLGAINALP